jgi:hypothetical protein
MTGVLFWMPVAPSLWIDVYKNDIFEHRGSNK